MLGADNAGTAPRLAPVAGGVQRAAAQPAAGLTRRRGKVPIKGEQKVVEPGITEQG